MGTSPEGCDLLETSTDSSVGYPRAPFASGRHARSTLPPNHLIPAHDSSPSARRYPPAGWWRRRRDPPGWGGTRSPPGAPLEGGAPGPPWKGVRDPPKKGGCRDTKQCKFWRVSSVLIQGTFCFLGVRGVSGGVGRGPQKPGFPRVRTGVRPEGCPRGSGGGAGPDGGSGAGE